jgi:hypothetical protein
MCIWRSEYLIFKTSTEEQTVDLTNKGMTKDSQRFSRWFHSVWRTTLLLSKNKSLTISLCNLPDVLVIAGINDTVLGGLLL